MPITPHSNQQIVEGLRPVSFGLGMLYLLFSVAHLFVLSGNTAVIMASVAFASAGLLLGLTYHWRKHTVNPRHANHAAILLVSIVLFNSLLHLALTGDLMQTTNIAMLILGLGIFIYSFRWFIGFTAFSWGCWLVTLNLLGRLPESTHYIFMLVEATLLSALALGVRIAALRREETLRAREIQQQQALAAQTRQIQQNMLDLEQAKQAAEVANRAKSAFLANVSHELRTPLTVILGYAEMLNETAGKEEGALLSEIEKAGHHLLQLINTLIDYARLEERTTPLNLETFTPQAILHPLAIKGEAWAIANQNRLEIVPPPELHLYSDPQRIAHIVEELVQNAAKFTRNGRIRVEVSQTIYEDQPFSVWRVTDTGPGIPPEQRKMLFQPFFQVNTAANREHGGIGLGLAFSQTIARELGGWIAFEAPQSGGAAFSLFVPTHLSEPPSPSLSLTSHVPIN